MTPLFAMSAAYREVLENPIRALWVGLVPLIMALAADQFITSLIGTGSNWPPENPPFLGWLVEPQVLGMRPFGPLFWLFRDLPWIWLAAIIIYRWQRLATSQWTRGLGVTPVWPLWNSRAFILVAAAALTANYAAGLMHWAENGFAGNTPEQRRAMLGVVSSHWTHGLFPPNDPMFRSYEPILGARVYLQSVREWSQILILPIGALLLSRFGLVVPTKAAGRPISLVRSWRLTKQKGARLFLTFLMGLIVASVVFLAAEWAVENLLGLDVSRVVIFEGVARSYDHGAPLGERITYVAGVLSFLLALFGITSLLAMAHRSVVGPPPAPEHGPGAYPG